MGDYDSFREAPILHYRMCHMDPRRFRRPPFWWLCAGALGLFLAAACRAQQPPPPASAQDGYRPTATIKDIMDSIVDPSADVLWESVATVITRAGAEERQPRTDEEWANVRRNAIRIIEATNLLQMPGRRVAKPGEKSENPGIELAPEEIEAEINKDRSAFVGFAHGLYDAALPALQAIDAKDVQALERAGEKLDEACEKCHLRYW